MGLSFLLGSNHYSISWWDFTTTPVLYKKKFPITQDCRRRSMAHLQNKYLRVTFLPKSHRSFLYYGIKSWPMLKTVEGIVWLICKINNQGLQLHPNHIRVILYYGVRSWKFAQDCRRHHTARLQNK